MSPESRFESKFTLASDIWGLACAIFEIRAGFPLFDPFIGGESHVLRQTVGMLGKLPEPWWSAFENREKWFDENGEPRPKEIQEQEGNMLPVIKNSIPERLRRIGQPFPKNPVWIRKIGGRYKSFEPRDEQVVETFGKQLEEEEVTLLSDLLGKMLKYRPEERIAVQEVHRHPWFKYTPAS